MKKMLEAGIVFMGTPHFAVCSLEALHKAGYQIQAVVTVPDKQQGRGLQLKPSPVKQYAISRQLPVLEPENLKDPVFIEKLSQLNADLFIVVAFRILPEIVWKIPRIGTINLHASLLPQYRGASPIQHAIMHGETTTGLTTFFIDNHIDTGKIIFREKVAVLPDETAGELHDRLKISGADLLVKTVDAVIHGKVSALSQQELMDEGDILRTAPKISKQDCKIDWQRTTADIYNQIRGLSPRPAAFTLLKSSLGKQYLVKIFKAKPHLSQAGLKPGSVLVENNASMFIATVDGLIELAELQVEGKNRMLAKDFLNGFKIDATWQAI